MRIKVFSMPSPYGDAQPVEIVERKGIGHPDTLADLVADTFSNMYSNYCLENFGAILHHWADKVTLVGGKSKITFGHAQMLAPIRAFQFGRVTPDIGDIQIDIDSLFEKAVTSVFSRVFPDSSIDKHLVVQTVVHDGAGPDHPQEFYDPKVYEEIQRENRSNDTSAVVAYAPYTSVERLVISLENHINSSEFKNLYPQTGSDVKIMAVREGTDVDLTICIPFVAERTPSLAVYKEVLENIRRSLLEKARQLYDKGRITININTKDRGEHVYLTAFGTSLDKGGCGAVGRGNRYNGVISPTKEMGIEAHAGKNPTHHVGRLYSELAYRIARDVFLRYGLANVVNIVSRNGEDLANPAFVYVKLSVPVSQDIDSKVQQIVHEYLEKIYDFPYQVIGMDPVWRHVARPLEEYSDFWNGGHL